MSNLWATNVSTTIRTRHLLKPKQEASLYSSLTPHKTGPNVSEEIRKAHIVQYAPDEAQLLHGEPHAGPPESKVPAKSLSASSRRTTVPSLLS